MTVRLKIRKTSRLVNWNQFIRMTAHVPSLQFSSADMAKLKSLTQGTAKSTINGDFNLVLFYLNNCTSPQSTAILQDANIGMFT